MHYTSAPSREEFSAEIVSWYRSALHLCQEELKAAQVNQRARFV